MVMPSLIVATVLFCSVPFRLSFGRKPKETASLRPTSEEQRRVEGEEGGDEDRGIENTTIGPNSVFIEVRETETKRKNREEQLMTIMCYI